MVALKTTRANALIVSEVTDTLNMAFSSQWKFITYYVHELRVQRCRLDVH